MQTLNTGAELLGPITLRHQPGPNLAPLSTYRCPNGVDDKASPSFMVLAGIGYENRHFRVLIEDLLDATVVYTLPGVLLACSSIVGFLGIAQILRVGNVIWRVQVGVTAGRRCGILFEGSCVESAPSSNNSGWRGELAYGETGRLSAVSRAGGTHAGRMPHRGCYPRRSTSCGGS